MKIQTGTIRAWQAGERVVSYERIRASDGTSVAASDSIRLQN